MIKTPLMFTFCQQNSVDLNEKVRRSNLDSLLHHNFTLLHLSVDFHSLRFMSRLFMNIQIAHLSKNSVINNVDIDFFVYKDSIFDDKKKEKILM